MSALAPLLFSLCPGFAWAQNAAAAPKAAPAPAAAPSPAPSKSDNDVDAAATPAQREEAKARFDRGLQLFSEADYKLALIEFERTFALIANYKVLYNIGQVRQQLGQYTRALEALEQYLAQGGDRIPAQRRTDVERDVSVLQTRTARVLVRVAQNDAAIRLDGAPFDTSPMASSRRVDAGEHTLTASKDGFSPVSRPIVLAGGDDVTVDLDLPLESAAGSGALARSDSGIRTPVLAAWTATGVLAVGSAVFGILTLREASKLDDLKNTAGATDATAAASAAERVASQNRGRAYAITTDIVGAVAIVAAGVAAYITWKPAPHRASDTSPDAQGLQKARLTVAPSRTGLTWQF